MVGEHCSWLGFFSTSYIDVISSPLQLQAAMCSVKGCDGVQVKSVSIAGRNYKRDQGASSWECDVCSRVTNPVSSTSFSNKNVSGVDKPWEMEVEAENRLAAAMGIYRERKFKDARILLERFLSDFAGKLVSSNCYIRV